MSFDPALQISPRGLLRFPALFILFVCGSVLAGCQGGAFGSSEPSSPYLPSEVHDDTIEANQEPALQIDLANPSAHKSASHESFRFDWPVNEARLTRGFFTQPKRRRGRPHLGIDLAAPKGTDIYAAHDGLVIYVGKEFRGYGRMVMVEGREGYATLYAHLNKASVRAGDRVHQGDLVGAMGRTGRATGVHLHFEIRRKDGPVDPLQYLPGGSALIRQAQHHYAPQIGLGLLEETWKNSQSLSLWPLRSPSSKSRTGL